MFIPRLVRLHVIAIACANNPIVLHFAGRVCVPFDPRNCEEFDPFAVPQLSALVDELNASGSLNAKVEQEEDGGEGGAKSAGKPLESIAEEFRHNQNPVLSGTSLGPYIKYFKDFLSDMDESIRESLRNKRAEEDRKLNF